MSDTDSSLASEFLTFTPGAEEYATDILKVQEIRGYEQTTIIANAPLFLKGVIDLRIKFGIGNAAPAFSALVDYNYIQGLASVNERMLVVADIERLILNLDMALNDAVH